MGKALSYPSCQAIVTMDADFSHDPKDVPRLVAEGHEVVIGSRYVAGGKIEGWKRHRKLFCWGANLFCRSMLRTGVWDNTTNFRYYSRDDTEAVLKAEGRDFEWVISALVAAKRGGFQAREIPVTFIDRENGVSKLGSRQITRWICFLLKSVFQKRGV